MVEATGCGCPVDTSVHSTEAPTEAVAETSNLRHLRLRRHLAVPKVSMRLGAARNFDRCASLCSLHRPQDALATSPKAILLCSQIKRAITVKLLLFWSRRQDSNLRHLAPKASALPNCATPRYMSLFSFVSIH